MLKYHFLWFMLGRMICRMHPDPPGKRGGGCKKNMAFRARFQKLRGGLLSGRAKFSEEARFSRATMFFCKRVISVATLL